MSIQLKRLRMQNFRRFADCDIPLEAKSGLVGLIGSNGSGKSTIVDAIGYALYGAQPMLTRTGKDDMKRSDAPDSAAWGAELDFTVGGKDYSVVRIIPSALVKKAKARVELIELGVGTIAEGDSAVKAKVIDIIGMDFQAFQASVYCRQSEVAALTGMHPGDRKKLMSRMLGIDSVDAAIQAARKDKRDLDVRIGALVDGLTSIDELLANKDGLNSAIDGARDSLDKRKAEQAAIRQEMDALQAERIVLLKKRSDINAYIGECDTLRMNAARKASLVGEAAKLDKQAAEESAKVAEADAALIATKPDTASGIKAAEDRLAQLRFAVSGLESRLANMSSLGDTCSKCGQSVRKEYADDIRHDISEDIDAGKAEALAIAGTLTELRAIMTRIEAESAKVVANDRILDRAKMLSSAAEDKRTEAGLISVGSYDQAQYDGARAGLAQADTALSANDAKMSECRSRYDAVSAQILKSSSELAGNEARLKDTLKRIDECARNQARVDDARVKTASLGVLDGALGDFRMALMGRVRPMLSAFTSDLVNRMTSGRYSKVELDEDYNISVYDRGVPYPIYRYSGGEQAVVNLGLRLALSQMIGIQSGSEGLGFIILDEVFSSADTERRGTIISTLDGLKNIYSQIFVITHIDAIVEALPDVIRVESSGTVSRIG